MQVAQWRDDPPLADNHHGHAQEAVAGFCGLLVQHSFVFRFPNAAGSSAADHGMHTDAYRAMPVCAF